MNELHSNEFYHKGGICTKCGAEASLVFIPLKIKDIIWGSGCN